MSVRRLLAAAIVAISVAVPVIESVDTWDHTLQDGNDTEANVVVMALCVGIALITAIRVATAVSRVRATEDSRPVPPSQFGQRRFASFLPPVPATSPPIALRI